MLECVQSKATELGNGLECKSQKNQLRELNLFSLEKKEAQRGLYHSLQLPEMRL